MKNTTLGLQWTVFPREEGIRAAGISMREIREKVRLIFAVLWLVFALFEEKYLQFWEKIMHKKCN